MRFFQNFTPPDFQAKCFTLSISPYFNSFSGKKTQKLSENGEIYTAAGTDGMDKFHLWVLVQVHLGQPVQAIPRRRCDAMWEGEERGFDQYREMYYEGSVSSFYFWDLDDGFVGVILIKNS